MRLNRSGESRRDRRGYALVMVMIVITVLSLAAYRFSGLMTAEDRASDRILLQAQSKALADAGIHYTAALLADPAAYVSTLNSNPYDNSDAFKGVVVGDPYNGRQGRFSIIAVDYGNPNVTTSASYIPQRWGVTDEASKLNLNGLMQLDSSGNIAATMLALPNFQNNSPAVADWLDVDETIRTDERKRLFIRDKQRNIRVKMAPSTPLMNSSTFPG